MGYKGIKKDKAIRCSHPSLGNKIRTPEQGGAKAPQNREGGAKAPENSEGVQSPRIEREGQRPQNREVQRYQYRTEVCEINKIRHSGQKCPPI